MCVFLGFGLFYRILGEFLVRGVQKHQTTLFTKKTCHLCLFTKNRQQPNTGYFPFLIIAFLGVSSQGEFSVAFFGHLTHPPTAVASDLFLAALTPLPFRPRPRTQTQATGDRRAAFARGAKEKTN
jgi:hypothetical protein